MLDADKTLKEYLVRYGLTEFLVEIRIEEMIVTQFPIS